MSIAQIVDDCIEASMGSAYILALLVCTVAGAEYGPQLIALVVG